jgi:DNA-binding transcriptional MerR regulator
MLLSLYEDENRESMQVKAVAEENLAQIDEKIEKLKSMRETLSSLVNRCSGNDRPDCPILADLAQIEPDPTA